MEAGMIPNVLSIAGSDPSGGAGIQADVKSISANGGYAMAAITALTVQNTRGVRRVELIDPDLVADQITAVFDDIRVDAVKIGMLGTDAVAQAVADVLRGRDVLIVLDPVMVAKGGDRLLAAEAVAALREALLPLCTVITPNLPEAADLLGEAEATDREGMEAQGARLLALGPKAVLLKGGHLQGPDSPDLFASRDGFSWIEGTRVATRNTHGTGCTLSSALATWLARLGDPFAASVAAKTYTARAIAGAEALTVGQGYGPIDHFPMLRTKE
jgi:hydroxymethylpyrimidine/phosphomethylpyrimidine kinase